MFILNSFKQLENHTRAIHLPSATIPTTQTRNVRTSLDLVRFSRMVASLNVVEARYNDVCSGSETRERESRARLFLRHNAYATGSASLAPGALRGTFYVCITLPVILEQIWAVHSSIWRGPLRGRPGIERIPGRWRFQAKHIGKLN